MLPSQNNTQMGILIYIEGTINEIALLKYDRPQIDNDLVFKFYGGMTIQ